MTFFLIGNLPFTLHTSSGKSPTITGDDAFHGGADEARCKV